MKTDTGYSPSEAFCPFPLPYDPIKCTSSRLADLALRHSKEREIARRRLELGITDCFLFMHNPLKSNAEVEALRALVREGDAGVCNAYGWSDLELGHDFYETKQGVRFTINESARREILQRLLRLNHERFDEEEKQGLHRKKGSSKKPSPRRKATTKTGKASPVLFDVEEDEA
jgi:hypothetical protein